MASKRNKLTHGSWAQVQDPDGTTDIRRIRSTPTIDQETAQGISREEIERALSEIQSLAHDLGDFAFSLSKRQQRVFRVPEPSSRTPQTTPSQSEKN